jgi:hypothetical protein
MTLDLVKWLEGLDTKEAVQKLSDVLGDELMCPMNFRVKWFYFRRWLHTAETRPPQVRDPFRGFPELEQEVRAMEELRARKAQEIKTQEVRSESRGEKKRKRQETRDQEVAAILRRDSENDERRRNGLEDL